MTAQQPGNPPRTEPDIPATEVISVAAPAPVFVDSTGRRSRLLRRMAYAFGALVMLYGGLISVSLAGGPVRSSAVLPLPGLEARDEADERPTVRPDPAPGPTPSRRPVPVFVAEALPRRAVAARAPRRAAPKPESTRIAVRPAPRPGPARTPKPATMLKPPIEKATTPPATKPPTTPPTSPPISEPPAPPAGTPAAPPLPPDGGGSGASPAVTPEAAA